MDRCGRILCLIITRLKCVSNDREDTETDIKADRLQVDYHHVHQEANSFRDPSLLDPVDKDQGEAVQRAVTELF